MKTVSVVAAIIVKDNTVLATQRGYGEFKDGWEFPGVKVEPNELSEDALKREIMEELETEISVDEFIDTIEYDYPAFHLSMKCYKCSIEKGSLKLIEHEASKWVSTEEIDSVDWLPADLLIISKIKTLLDGK